MTNAARAALAIGVLALAGLLAVLPLVGDDADDGTPDAAGQPDGGALADARERTELPDCPSADATGAPDTGAAERSLAGVAAICLADGTRIDDLGAALSGEETLINVWATWCAPCREELPVLQDYAEDEDAAEVLTVQVDSAQVDGVRMLDELGVALPAVHDGDGRGPVRTALQTPASLPASYLVDADGGVSFVADPRVFTDVEQVRQAVQRYGGAA